MTSYGLGHPTERSSGQTGIWSPRVASCSGVDVRKFLVLPWSGGRHPKGAAPGIGAAHITEYVPTRHQPMIILVILSNQPRGGNQQNAATGKGVVLARGAVSDCRYDWFFLRRHLLGYLVDT